ncbi:MAG TPA: MFS transporter, partial [Thermoanaerobaculia bacterium]|nr:MFS transporter [Thermoanaerobaculia bacterium]
MKKPGVSRDVAVLFATRIARLFAYGLVSVILVLYLAARGVSESRIGILLFLTLAGDTLISLFLTVRADAIGRRKVLIVSSLLVVIAGVVFATTGNYVLLLIAATIGVISPSGNEVGPFLAVEQVVLSQTATGAGRVSLFAWYNLVGSFATAIGALVAGQAVTWLQHQGRTPLASYGATLWAYALSGLILALMFALLTPAAETTEPPRPASARFHLVSSGPVVARLSALFALDSFGGGFVVQALVAYWFHVRYGLDPAMLGRLFFGANLIAGFSALAAAGIARRIGLLRTMVFTHLPSNVLLILVPLMPNVNLAMTMLLLRFSISQMDVPSRQAYVMSVVPPTDRSAAAGITGVARTIGASIAPLIATPLMGSRAYGWIPFVLAGGFKI